MTVTFLFLLQCDSSLSIDLHVTVLRNDIGRHPPIIIFQKTNREANISHTHTNTYRKLWVIKYYSFSRFPQLAKSLDSLGVIKRQQKRSSRIPPPRSIHSKSYTNSLRGITAGVYDPFMLSYITRLKKENEWLITIFYSITRLTPVSYTHLYSLLFV